MQRTTVTSRLIWACVVLALGCNGGRAPAVPRAQQAAARPTWVVASRADALPRWVEPVSVKFGALGTATVGEFSHLGSALERHGEHFVTASAGVLIWWRDGKIRRTLDTKRWLGSDRAHYTIGSGLGGDLLVYAQFVEEQDRAMSTSLLYRISQLGVVTDVRPLTAPTAEADCAGILDGWPIFFDGTEAGQRVWTSGELSSGAVGRCAPADQLDWVGAPICWREAEGTIGPRPRNALAFGRSEVAELSRAAHALSVDAWGVLAARNGASGVNVTWTPRHNNRHGGAWRVDVLGDFKITKLSGSSEGAVLAVQEPQNRGPALLMVSRQGKAWLAPAPGEVISVKMNGARWAAFSHLLVAWRRGLPRSLSLPSHLTYRSQFYQGSIPASGA